MHQNTRDMAIIDEHIKILEELATLSPGTFMMGKGQYLIKTTARDIIEAGRRLEELQIFKFNKDDSDNEIKVTYIE